MSVEIDPQELGFHRPFTVEVSEVLKIRNPNTQPVAFKVKTTAPKQYCVRPNSGRIEPGKEVEVQVILQAMKQEPPLDTRCRDKFLVQSVPITSDKEFSNLTAIWDSIDKSQVIEKKIRVVFLSPRGSAGAGPSEVQTPKRESTTSNGYEATPDAAPPAYSSPSDYRQDDKSEDIKHEESSPSVLANAAAAASTAASVTYEELKVQLEKAQQTISQLKQDQGGLRQRKAGPGEEKSTSAQLGQQVRQGTEGVPIQMTAILCLLSFLLAYLFF
ncbi:phosphatidylinositol-binding protein scs2 [Apiospora saccharicola]|uniref:Phosphatidylinositol-binding protein scs2 n=1 Tax=Apiospora saccharicola TaxID=335842 RepID=A0ABR1VCL3_9PEZI